jgi:hypothetical protein
MISTRWGAAALAEALQAEIDSGRTEAYAKIRQAELNALPMGKVARWQVGLAKAASLRR